MPPNRQGGQAEDSSRLTIDRLFASREFSTSGYGPIRWLDGGSAYTTVERSAEIEGAKDIVRYETASGKRSILVPASKLRPQGAERPLVPESYEWSSDKRFLLISTNTRRVWRVNSRGDYWVCHLAEDGNLWKVGGDAPASSLMFAKFSPDANHLAYLRGNNIYVQDLGSRAITQLTSDGSATIINGTFDWVYEEEFFCRDGFRWSPDSKSIAFWQIDASSIKKFYMINNTDSV